LANDSVESIAFNKMTFGTSPFSLVQTNNNSYQLLENFSKVTGNHSVKLGGQFLYQAVKLLPDLIANEQFQFFGSATGMDFADFLLGLPSVYNQGFSPAFYQRSRYAGPVRARQLAAEAEPHVQLRLAVGHDNALVRAA
jgi:hypothetical protein